MSAERPPVYLLAYTGYILRDLLLGRFGDEVASRREMVVAVQDPADPRLIAAVLGRPIRLVDFPSEDRPGYRSRWERTTRWQTYIYRFKQAQKRTESGALQARVWESRLGLRGRVLRGGLLGVGRFLDRTGLIPKVEDRYLDSVRKWPLVGVWRERLAAAEPACLVSTMLTRSGHFRISVDLPPLIAAHDLGIPTISLVQSWDNLASKPAVLPPWVDRYCTWSETMTRQLLEFNPRVGPDAVAWVGSPHFDCHPDPGMVGSREALMRELGLDPARPYVVVGTSTPRQVPQEPPTVIGLVGALATRVPECQVVVRVHPKDRTGRWGRMPELDRPHVAVQTTAAEGRMDRGAFETPEEFFGKQLTTLRHAAVVVNTASTLTVDAAILDRPVVSIAYDPDPEPLFPEGRARLYNRSTHFRPLADSGGVHVATSEADCVEAIARYLREPERDREGRRRIVEIVTGRVDGRSGERFAAQVLEVADGDGRSAVLAGREAADGR